MLLCVGEVYGMAAAMDAEHRAAFLTAACGDDEALRQEVELLLGFREQAGWIDRPAMEIAARAGR